jgi:hypothetical protein
MRFSDTVQNYLATVPMDGVLPHPIFVTGDNAVAYVAGKCIPRAVFQSNGEPFLSTSEVDTDLPYFAQDRERLERLVRSRVAASHARVARDAARRFEPDQSQIDAEVQRLEHSVMEAWTPRTL